MNHIEEAVNQFFGHSAVQKKIDQILTKQLSLFPDKSVTGDPTNRRFIEAAKSIGVDPRVFEARSSVTLNEASVFGNKYKKDGDGELHKLWVWEGRPFYRAAEIENNLAEQGAADANNDEPYRYTEPFFVEAAEESEDSKPDNVRFVVDLTRLSDSTSGQKKSIWFVDSAGEVIEALYTNKSKEVNKSFSASDKKSASSDNGVSWDQYSNEPAACMGATRHATFDISDKLAEISGSKNEATEAYEEIKELVATMVDNLGSYDVDDSIVTMFQNRLSADADDYPGKVSDVIKFAELAGGVQKFVNDVGLNGDLNFVADQISEYYEAEEEAGYSIAEFNKVNTTDFVLCEGNDSASKFIDSIKEADGDINWGDEAGGDPGICKLSGGPRFVQVSHKIAFGSGSQLGRVLTTFRDMFDLADNDEIDQFIKETDDLAINNKLQTEAIGGAIKWAKSALNKVQNVGRKIMGSVKETISNVWESFSSAIGKVVSTVIRGAEATIDKEVSDNEEAIRIADSIIQHSINDGLLDEAINEDLVVGDMNNEDKASYLAESWNNGGDFSGIYDKIATELRQVQKLVDDNVRYGSLEGSANPREGYVKASGIPSTNSLGENSDEIDSGEITRIWGTYQQLRAIKEFMLQKKKEGLDNKFEGLINDFQKLQTEMVFGSTSLPLYKVSNKSWNLLKTGGDYQKALKEEFDVIKKSGPWKDSPLVWVYADAKVKGSRPNGNSMGDEDGESVSKGHYLTTHLYVVDGYVERSDKSLQPTYTKFEFRTEGHPLSFAVTGKQSGIPHSSLVKSVS